MQITPATIARRYSPLILLAIVQVVLVAVAPSVPGGAGTDLATTSSGLAAGTSGSGTARTGTGGAASVDASGSASGSAGTDSTGLGGTSADAAAGPGASATEAGGTTGGPGTTVAGGDRSHCDAAGLQWGPTFYRPPCQPVWSGGDNGGASMKGYSATQISYVFYRSQGNAAVNAILGQEGLAATDEQACEAMQAFHNELNKRWEFYGRKLVSLDGSGTNAGSKVAKNCHFPFFQGQCSLTPPDPPCERAEADVIAAMKPAYVMAPVADPAFYNELAKNHIVVAGGETEPDSYHQDDAPYYYDSFMNGTRDVTMTAEFYCKELAGKPVQFAGPDVTSHPGGAPKRKLAIVYPQTNGDPSYTLSATAFIKLVTGGMCGSPSDGVKGYPYASDITQAETQATTIIGGLKASGVTTVVFFGDPIAPVFLSNTAAAQHYHPEWLMTGIGLVDYDVLAQLYNSDEWRYAFGISTLADNVPFEQSDAVKAWHDVGLAGLPDRTENLAWAYFAAMGNALQMAGPAATPLTIRAGLFNAAPMGGDHLHPLQEYGRPDDYTGLRDARIVYFCPTQRSPINNNLGSYVSYNGGQRFQLGQIPTTQTVFPHGPCGA